MGLVGRGGLPVRAHVEKVDKEIVRQGADPVGEDPVGAATVVGTEDPQAANKDGDLRSAQGEQIRPFDEVVLRWQESAHTLVVAEPIDGRFERREGLGVGLLGSRIAAPQCDGDGHGIPASACAILNACRTGDDEHVSHRNLPAAFAVERGPHPFEGVKNSVHLGRLVHLPAPLRLQPDPGSVGAAPLVAPAERRGRRPRR
jgi:hypothetical protein